MLPHSSSDVARAFYCCLLATATATGNDTHAFASAQSDVTIETGGACPARFPNGAVMVFARNNNTSKTVFASVEIDSDVPYFPYIDVNGNQKTFYYPLQSTAWIAAGLRVQIGCSKLPVSGAVANQSFKIVGAVYPQDNNTPPPPPDNPMNFVGWIFAVANPSPPCSAWDRSVNLLNWHPSRDIAVSGVGGGDGFSGEYTFAESDSERFGCLSWGAWKITSAQFKTGERPALKHSKVINGQ